MRRTVYKYRCFIEGLPKGAFTLELPIGSDVLHADIQGAGLSDLHIWAYINAEQTETRPHHFLVAGTGHTLPDEGDLFHINTIKDHQFIWHVFEVFHGEEDKEPARARRPH